MKLDNLIQVGHNVRMGSGVVEDDALQHLVRTASGDARRALTGLEAAAQLDGVGFSAEQPLMLPSHPGMPTILVDAKGMPLRCSKTISIPT